MKPELPYSILDWRQRPQFLGCPGFAGMIAGRHQSAAQGGGAGFETTQIVALPAMEGNGDAWKLFQRGVNVDAEFGVTLFGQIKTLFNFLHVFHDWIWDLVFYPDLPALSLTIAPIISTKGTRSPDDPTLKKD